MKNSIEDILSMTGPTLSSNVVRILASQGVDPVTARQQISRAKRVRRLHGFKFPNRESFLCLPEHSDSELYKENLTSALLSSGSAFGRFIRGLEARAGTSPSRFLPIISGQPTRPTKKQVLHKFVEDKLEEHKLACRTVVDDVEYYTLWHADAISPRRRAVMIVEDIVLSATRAWLAKVGWTSTHAPTVRGLEPTQPHFGQFAWDLVGPSYLQAIRGFEKKKVINGFIVADILLDRTVSVVDLAPFLNKWAALFHQYRKTRFQPIFIAEGLQSDALDLLRERGCFVAIPEVIFGKEAARELSLLATTIENAAREVTNNPDAVFKLLAQVSKIEGAALNARGIIIELMMGHFYKWDGHQIDFSVIAKNHTGERAEIDVKASKGNELICCECKGYGSGRLANKKDLETWVEVTLPRIKNWLKRNPSFPNSKRFEFFVSTDYMPDARAYADAITATHLHQPVHFYSGADVIKRLKKMNQPELIQMFTDQYGEPTRPMAVLS